MPLRRFGLACLALAPLLANAPAGAGPATEALKALLASRYEALAQEYGDEAFPPDTLKAASDEMLRAVSDEDRRRLGNRFLPGRWRDRVALIAGKLCQAHGWPCRTVEVSDHLAPWVGYYDNKLIISRAALALAQNDSEVAAMLLPTLWLHNRPEQAARIALTNQATGDQARAYGRGEAATKARATAEAEQLIAALFWGTQIEGPKRRAERYGEALAKAGYQAEAAKSIDLLYSHWDRLQHARGVGHPDFMEEPEAPPEEVERTPADPAFLKQLEGLPMGVDPRGSLLVGNQLLIAHWEMKLILPREYDWKPYGEGAIASEPWQAEEVTIEPFNPAKNVYKAPFFRGLPDYLQPVGPSLTADNDEERSPIVFTPSRGRTGTRRDQPEIIAYSAVWDPYGAFFVTQSGSAEEAPRRRQELMESLDDRIRRFNEEDAQTVKPRPLRLATLKTHEEATRLLARLSEDEERMLRVLNGLSATERLPTGRPLKYIHYDMPLGEKILKAFKQ